MSRIETERTADINFPTKVVRMLIAGALSPVLRSEVTDINNNAGKAERELSDGKGLIVVFNHFSGKDPIQAIYEIFHNRVMNKKKIITPIGFHIDNPLDQLLGRMTGVTVKPIVTKSTIMKGKNHGRRLNDGQKDYFGKSIVLLRNGGIMATALQPTRLSRLGQPETLTMGTFMLNAKRNGFDDYSYLFVGFGIKGLNDYSKNNIKGLNIIKKYTTNIGSCLTGKEILEKANGDYRKVDDVIYEELKKVVPKSYR